jgi:hypothetical protein
MQDVKMIVCIKCGAEKPLAEFYLCHTVKGTPYHRTICKACCVEKMRDNRRTVRTVQPKRLPSIECQFTCPTCGMGADTADAALKCCERVVQMVMDR